MTSSAAASIRRWATALAAAGALGLAACDGGDVVEVFVPARIVAFGDEWSAITPDGRKYGINAVDATTGAPDCASFPVWVQSLAVSYGLRFAECNPGGGPVGAVMRAAAGARSDDVAAALAAYVADGVAGGAAADTDLVTVLAGLHDVLDAYARYAAAPAEATRAALADELTQRGRALAVAVNRTADRGPRVIVATVPAIGLSPWAAAETLAHPGENPSRSAVLAGFVAAFNDGLRLRLLNDGRRIGLVFADTMVQDMTGSPSAFGLRNVTTAACANAAPPPATSPDALLACTNGAGGLVEGATATTWLWADALRPAPAGQARLGTLAISRARNNPF